MARAISPFGRYSIQIIEADERIVLDKSGHAISVPFSKPVIANFQQGGLMAHEIEAALERFNFSGVPDGVNPLTRLSVFDTESYALARGMSKDELKAMDDRFEYLAEINPSEFILVPMPLAPRPWPSYDDDSPEDIVEFQSRLGIPAEVVRLYESENKNRKSVLEAMANQEGLDLETGAQREEAIVVNA